MEINHTVLQLLSNPIVVDLVTESVLEKKIPMYTWTTTTIRDDGSLYFVYTTQRTTEAKSDVIVLRVDKDVRATSMKQSVDDCLQVSDQHYCEMYLIILCTGQISQVLKNELIANLDNSYRQKSRYVFWAKDCLFVSKVTINNDSEDAEPDLDPLAALTLYIASNNEERLELKNVANSTIQLLYTVLESSGSEV
ncbi:unnamed protein product [Rhizopus stolonifer]